MMQRYANMHPLFTRTISAYIRERLQYSVACSLVDLEPDALEAVMAEYAGKRHGLHYAFHTVPDAVMKGTAIAALG